MRIKFVLESIENKDITVEGIEIEHTLELEELKELKKANIEELKKIIKKELFGGKA